MNERVDSITRALQTEFAPTHLLVKDQSHLHAGHAGARDGRGHFAVEIVAAAFSGKTRVKRHQMVYESLGEMMQTDIHALSIRAKSPDEISD